MREATANARSPIDRDRRGEARQAPETRSELRQRRGAANAPSAKTAAVRSVSRELHPLIYKAIGALTVCFVASAWALARDARAAYLLAIVAGFIGLVALLSWVAQRVWRDNYPSSAAAERSEAFADWAARGFETGSGLTTGRDAAIQILAPIAAVALGMAALVLVTGIAG